VLLNRAQLGGGTLDILATIRPKAAIVLMQQYLDSFDVGESLRLLFRHDLLP
jgi:hypothetical protein